MVTLDGETQKNDLAHAITSGNEVWYSTAQEDLHFSSYCSCEDSYPRQLHVAEPNPLQEPSIRIPARQTVKQPPPNVRPSRPVT